MDTKLAYVSVTDADSNDNGQVFTHIETSLPDDAWVDDQDSTFREDRLRLTFNLENDFISLKKPLDREKVDKYQIEVEACDHGDKRR